VELIVRDTGCGMDAATKARIFEPFFTTKPAGKGTGLGLATVFGIVKQTGGFMEVESAPGDGTSFHVYLPGTTESVQAEVAVPAAVAPVKSAQAAQETVLLVDDEDEIRELAAYALEEHGYKVLSASHAEEAILLAEKHPKEIRALITDVVMPGINGVQLAGIVGKIVPNLRVLFVSGHSNESISAETLQETRGSYLQKPYRTAALIAKVSETISGTEKSSSPAPRQAGSPSATQSGQDGWVEEGDSPWVDNTTAEPKALSAARVA
jgi:FixJ family two-component response regulator